MTEPLGYCTTKSRLYSTTFGALRAARREHQEAGRRERLGLPSLDDRQVVVDSEWPTHNQAPHRAAGILADGHHPPQGEAQSDRPAVTVTQDLTVFNVTKDAVIARQAKVDDAAPPVHGPSQTKPVLDPQPAPPPWWNDALLDL